MDVLFTSRFEEGKFRATAQVKDKICYEMLKHLDVLALGKLIRCGKKENFLSTGKRQ